jgi:hypothetical protein
MSVNPPNETPSLNHATTTENGPNGEGVAGAEDQLLEGSSAAFARSTATAISPDGHRERYGRLNARENKNESVDEYAQHL